MEDLCYTNMAMNRVTVQKIGLALSIIIVLNLFFNYGIYTFYPSPKYEDFCTEEITRKAYDTKESCEAIGGVWITSFSQEFGGERAVPIKPEGEAEFKSYCDATFTCRENWQDIRSIYNRNVFIILVILGLLSVIAGLFAASVSAVSSGLLYGGFISFFIGTVRFWSDMNEYLRFIILGIVLVVLIVIGYKKLNDRKESVDRD